MENEVKVEKIPNVSAIGDSKERVVSMPIPRFRHWKGWIWEALACQNLQQHDNAII